MATRKILVVTDAWIYDPKGENIDDVLVVVEEDERVVFRADSAGEMIRLVFDREEWQQIVDFVAWQHKPPMMAGRE